MKLKMMVIISLFLILAVGCRGQESYELSGQVVDGTEVGVEDVSLHIGADGLVRTDQEGRWSKVVEEEQLTKGEVLIRPAKEGYHFIPQEKKITSLRQDIEFEAVKSSYFEGDNKIYAIELQSQKRILLEEVLPGEEYKILFDLAATVENEELARYLRALELEYIDLAVINSPYPGEIERLIGKFEEVDPEDVVDPAIEGTVTIVEDYLVELAEDNIELIEGRFNELKWLISNEEVLEEVIE
ncbi:hypothetical protein MWH28_11715 [Natroniella sulfidigena]|uniref:hypothetical protein n=1 Tax=Natroniella sulfidigena TaxID=723921 RepID=UPI00200B80A5|nr:hypothetical protein [Natroniella sulfidigena]MCK8818024.1 hypothetical protein [Natroniella sulfidigena]